MASGQNSELITLIQMLPEAIRTDPLIRVWHAYGLLPMHPETAQAEFRAIRCSVDPTAQPEVCALAVGGEVKAALSDWPMEEGLPRIVQEIDLGLSLLGVVAGPVRQNLIVARSLALLVGCPSHPEVMNAQRDLEAIMPSLPPARQLHVGSILMNYLLWWRGDLGAARACHDWLQPLANTAEMPPLARLYWYYGALAIAFREGNLEAFDICKAEAIGLATKWGIASQLWAVHWIDAQMSAALGDHERAAEAIQQYQVITWNRRQALVGPRTLKASLALCTGDNDGAIAHALQASADAAEAQSAQDIGNVNIVLATALARKGDTSAHIYIAQLRDQARDAGNSTLQLHVNMAEAYLAYAQGQTEAFLRLWMKMAHTACDLGFRLVIGMNVEHLSRLAIEALDQGANPDLTRRLIRLWRLVPPQDGRVYDKWPHLVQIRCLGGFSVTVEGKATEARQGKAQSKPLELLWLLITAGGSGLYQDMLADQLWPELEGDRALHTLRTTLYRLRKLLGTEAVLQEDEHIRLDPRWVATDLDWLQTSILRMQDPRLPDADRLEALDSAMRIYRGQLLPGAKLAAVADKRRWLKAMLVEEALGFLLTLKLDRPEILLRVRRLQSIAPDVTMPETIRRLWES